MCVHPLTDFTQVFCAICTPEPCASDRGHAKITESLQVNQLFEILCVNVNGFELANIPSRTHPLDLGNMSLVSLRVGPLVSCIYKQDVSLRGLGLFT